MDLGDELLKKPVGKCTLLHLCNQPTISLLTSRQSHLGIFLNFANTHPVLEYQIFFSNLRETQILLPYQPFTAIIWPEVSLGLSSLQWKIAQITLISLPHSASNPRPSSKCGCAITDNFSHFHFLYLENNFPLPSTCQPKSETNSLLTGCQSSTGRNTTALTRQRELFVAILFISWGSEDTRKGWFGWKGGKGWWLRLGLGGKIMVPRAPHYALIYNLVFWCPPLHILPSPVFWSRTNKTILGQHSFSYQPQHCAM